MIRIGILSDLHMSVNDTTQDEVLENIVNFFEEEKVLGKMTDLVVVTGDITLSGQMEEFENAKLFLERLLSFLELSTDRIFITPGNHDYNKNSFDTAFKYVESLSSTQYDEILNSSDFKKHSELAFSHYHRFHELIYGEKIPNLYGYSKDVTIDEYTFHISVVNSCLVNSIGKDNFLPYIDIQKLKDLSRPKEDYDFSILVQHHPPHCLYPDNRRRMDEFIKKSFDLVLVGHEHFPEFFQKNFAGNRQYTCLTTGSAYIKDSHNPEKYLYRFSVIDYDPSFGQGQISFLKTRKNMDYCFSDTRVIYEGRKDGIIPFIINERNGNSFIDENNNPLEKFELNQSLSEFFDKNYNKILGIEKRKDLMNIRKNSLLSNSLKLTELALLFLKYSFTKKMIVNFEQLQEALNEIFLFREIQFYHKTILAFYDENYFKTKKQNIKDYLSFQKKKLTEFELKQRLIEAESEIQQLRRSQTSIIKNYRTQSIELLPPLPEKDEEEGLEHGDWYELLKLKTNPFPSKDGLLETFSEEVLNEILYYTNSITHFKKVILNDFNSLRNVTIGVYGSLGSGKTTLFEFMRTLIKLHHPDTLVVSISIQAKLDFVQMERIFFRTLNRDLKRIHINKYSYVPIETDPEEDCINTLIKLSEDYKRLFVFIEDIYKHSGIKEYKEEVINFIRSFQINRKECAKIIETSFFFSGLEGIIRDIRNDRTIGGSIADLHKISPISLDDAVKMINQRLKSFAINPDNPPFITNKYLSRLKKMEKHAGRPINTFREYIDIVLTRFKRLEFDEESISIRDNDIAIFNALKDIQTSHKDIFSSFLELKKFSKENKETFEKFIKILEDLWLGKSIEEGSYKWMKFKRFLVYLDRIDMLETVPDRDRVTWTISSKCAEYFNKIENIYQVRPVNIIPSIIFFEDLEKIEEDEVSIALSNILRTGQDYGNIFLEKVHNALEGYKTVFNFSKSMLIINEKEIAQFDVEIISNSFSEILISYVIQNGSDIQTYKEALIQHDNSWYEVEQVSFFASLLRDSENKMISNVNDKVEIISQYLSAFKEITSKMKRHLQWDNWFTLKETRIWNNSKRRLNYIRQNIENRHYKNVLRRIDIMLRIKLKNFIFDYCNIIFGNNKWKRGLPESINLKIKKYTDKIKSNYKIWDEKEILRDLTLYDFFLSIDYLSKTKLSQKVGFLEKVNDLCIIISNKLFNREKDENLWIIEILNLIEILDNFYYNTLNGIIPCPWNSDLYQKIDDISFDYDDNEISKNEKLLQTNLTLDSEFMIKDSNFIKFKLREFLVVVNSELNSYKIDIDYQNEEIEINKVAKNLDAYISQ